MNIDVTKFLNESYAEAAVYLAFRNTANYIDGLKNSTRKAIYTLKKKGLNKPVKVSGLAASTVDTAEYLHGESGMQGAIVTAAKSYCGSNNLPILEGIGAFGTRFSNKASAPRYIFVKGAPYFEDLFKPEDDINLKAQTFEGKEIEPVYYVPTLPLLLVNGSSGIGVGFASDIFPRSTENMFKAIRAKLSGKKLKTEWFTPYWRGFKGTVEQVENSWVVKGKATFNGKKVLIDEVPPEWELKAYQEHLKGLKEDGKILRYNDYAEDEVFKFEVVLSEEEMTKSEEVIMKDLGLIKSMSETISVIDENNAVNPDFTSAKDIFESYYKIKIKFLEARKLSEIQRLENEELLLNEKYRFIMEVIKGTVDIRKKKAEVEKILKQKGYTVIEELLRMPVYSLTEDKAEELKQIWKNKISELEAMKAETPESLWGKDLNALETKLKKLGVIENGN